MVYFSRRSVIGALGGFVFLVTIGVASGSGTDGDWRKRFETEAPAEWATAGRGVAFRPDPGHGRDPEATRQCRADRGPVRGRAEPCRRAHAGGRNTAPRPRPELAPRLPFHDRPEQGRDRDAHERLR